MHPYVLDMVFDSYNETLSSLDIHVQCAYILVLCHLFIIYVPIEPLHFSRLYCNEKQLCFTLSSYDISSANHFSMQNLMTLLFIILSSHPCIYIPLVCFLIILYIFFSLIYRIYVGQ